ncbi:MAG: lipopolysaccharide transport periplasmic protein LptA [Pseudomonadota bacterium]
MFRRSRPRGLAALFVTLGVGLLPAPAPRALPEDRLQAIEITAARAERNEPRGYTLYSGDVVLIQGSLRIEADNLTIFHDQVAADRIIAQGAPARLQQRPALDKPFVKASAERIVYEKSSELVLLRIDARIEQEGAIVTGESIRYFMAEQRVRADSEDESSRVQVFIPAEVVEQASQDGSDSPAPETDVEPAPAESDEGGTKSGPRDARGGSGGT